MTDAPPPDADPAPDLDRLWRDDAHWGHGAMGMYFCKDDPRLFVRKRHAAFGRTINLAHPRAGWVLMALIVLPVMLAVLARRAVE